MSQHRRDPEAFTNRGLLSATFHDLGRLGRIGAVLIRHGFGQLATQLGLARAEEADGASTRSLAADPRGTARRFRAVLEDLGTTFIKLGQVLSTRPDLLPPDFIRELSRLQDSAPPLAFEQARAQIEAELGATIEASFAHLDPTPLASGSIAQTHVARLGDGREVVIKIQRPDLEPLIQSDLSLMRLLTRLLEATIHEMGLYSPTAIVDEFELALRMELDFVLEAHNLRQFREMFAADPRIWIPDVIEHLSTRRMLVLERIPGVKITELEPDTPRAHKLALVVVDMLYQMLFEHGDFHGDPHPGNVLVTDDDRIGLIDFGLVGHLSRHQQDTLVALIIAVVSGDIDGVARAVLSLGRAEGRVDLRAMRGDIIEIRGRYLRGALGEVDLSAFVLELLEAGQRHRIRVPADWALLAKATVSLEGIVRTLHPDLDLPATLQPYARRLLLQRYGPDRLAGEVLAGALSLSALVRELPTQLHQLMLDFEHGGVRVQVESEPLSALGPASTRLATRLVLGMIAAALVIGLFITLSLPVEERVWGVPSHTFLAVVTLTSVLTYLWLHIRLDGRRPKLRLSRLLRRFSGRGRRGGRR